MSALRGYFTVTLWRAILKLATLATLFAIWLANTDSALASGLLIGAAVLWIVDGCDHGIDTIRRRRNRT